MPPEKKTAKKTDSKEPEPVVMKKEVEAVVTSKKTKSENTNTKVVKESAPKEEVKKTVAKKEEEIVDDSDSESEIEAGSEEEQEDGDMKLAKEKKTKKSFDELHDDFEKNSADIKVKKGELNDLNKMLKAKEKEISDLERQQSKIWAQFSKAKEEDVKKAAKNKPKRKGNKEGGFNKPVPVPLILTKYLGIEDGILMSRPKLMSAVTDKFKEEGLKKGQLTTLDAKAAKALGKDKGREIPFGGFQTFLAEFFNDNNTTVEVSI